MSVETDLLTALHERLNGNDSHGQALTVNGSTIPVYTGEAPTDKSAPYVVLERPRNRPDETIDKQVQHRIRQQIRIHTAYESGMGDYYQGYQIADAIHDLIRAADVTIGGDDTYFPEPNRQPVPSYSKGPESAYDITIRYNVLI